MATTPNYGWVTPAPTDLVTDLPADFEIFADAVDADLAGLLGGTTGQVLKKTSGTDHDFAFGVDPTFDLVTTAGDLVYGTAADTMARLGIGTAGQVLSVNSGATAPEWANAAAGAPNVDYSLLNSGGTSLSGSTTTISGITDKSNLLINVFGASTSVSTSILLRINADSGASQYLGSGFRLQRGGTYIEAYTTGTSGSSSFNIVNLDPASATGNFTIHIFGGNSNGYKAVNYLSSQSGTTDQSFQANGIYLGSAKITSVSLVTASGTFDAGTIFVYGG